MLQGHISDGRDSRYALKHVRGEAIGSEHIADSIDAV